MAANLRRDDDDKRRQTTRRRKPTPRPPTINGNLCYAFGKKRFFFAYVHMLVYSFRADTVETRPNSDVPWWALRVLGMVHVSLHRGMLTSFIVRFHVQEAPRGM